MKKFFYRFSYRIMYLVLFALALCFISTVWAGTSGKIAGIVVEKGSDEPVVGANIYLEGEYLGASTDVDGFYFILNVPPGTYTLVAQSIGYKEMRFTSVRVNVDLTTTVNIEMEQEAIEGEVVVVVAEKPLITKDLTSSKKNISFEEIEALPVEDFQEIVELQAGVVDGHFRGGRAGEVAYMVDGVPVNDPFNNTLGLELENSSIQQLEVISGTFNAEYGQALSGVVNIVTKEGGKNYDFNVMTYAGNYYTTHDNIFPNLDRFDGQGAQNLQLTVSGPLPFVNSLKFFTTGRIEENEGHIFGPDLYAPSDNSPYMPSGDSSFVPINGSRHYSFNGKLTYYLLPELKLNYSFTWDDNQSRNYNHGYRLVRNATKKHFRTNTNHNIQINHLISSSTFYTLSMAQNENRYKGYVYKDPYDLRYFDSVNGAPQSTFTFRSGGNESDRYRRKSTTQIIKADLNSQVSRVHKITAGVMYKQHEIYNFSTNLDISNSSKEDSIIVYPSRYSPGHNEYLKKPREFSAYVQDKLEFDDFIINIGLRYDWFDPRTVIPRDPRNPELVSLFDTRVVQASEKHQLSPRLGVAFPISTQGVIHVSYGHFFQMPNFQHLYQGIVDTANISKYYLGASGGLRGNPDLKAQSTIMYEIGLQQGLTEEFAVEFTAYYRDIRNLVGTEVFETYNVKDYGRFTNRDYGNVRGVILSFEKRFSDNWGTRIDYTYQVAEGNASDPSTVWIDSQSDPPVESEKKLLRLDWDQRSTFNMAFNFGEPGSWNIGLIGRYGTGLPYTLDARYQLATVLFRNNRTKPYTYSVDLRAEKSFRFGMTKIKMFLWISNLFDRLNELQVFTSSGLADYPLNLTESGDIIGLHTAEDYIVHPDFYSEPRLIRLGLSVGF